MSLLNNNPETKYYPPDVNCSINPPLNPPQPPQPPPFPPSCPIVYPKVNDICINPRTSNIQVCYNNGKVVNSIINADCNTTCFKTCTSGRVCQGKTPSTYIRALQYTESGQFVVGFSDGSTCNMGTICKYQNILFSQNQNPDAYCPTKPLQCGEVFINLETGNVFRFTGQTWVVIGNIIGSVCPVCPTGLDGPTGPIGPTGPNSNYTGTGFFGPGFSNAQTTTLDILDYNQAISLLRQPNTFYPTFFGTGIGTDSTRIPDQDAVVLGNHNDATGPNNANYAVAIGYYSGQLNQSSGAIAIGYQSGYNTQGIDAVAIGDQAGYATQGSGAIAIGQMAGNLNQGTSAIAIGEQAGFTDQGSNSIAIGNMAGYSGQASNSIVISAAGSAINNTTPSSCVVYPIRNVNGTASNRLYWDPLTFEITYGTEPSSIRYKQDVIDLPQKYIDGIYQLRPVEFSFKTCPEKRNVGLIAEEVNEIMPEIIIRNAIDDTIIEGINYEHLVAPLINVVKHYKDVIDQHQLTLLNHKNRLKILEDQFL